MKKLFKYLGGLLLVVVLIASAFFVHVWYFKPYDINLFFGKTALQFALNSPETLSSVRVLEGFGIDGHNAELDDASMAAGDEAFAFALEAHETLLSYEDEDLNATDKMSKDVMLSLLDIVVDGERFRFHNYPVNQLFGVQNGFPSFMESTHQVEDQGDAEDYVSRLSKVGIKFDQVLEGLKHRENLGILPPQFVVTKVLEEMNGFVNTPAEDNILFTALAQKMETAELPQATQNEIAVKAKSTIEQTVYPAYQNLIDYFVKLDVKVSDNHGVWSLPDGDAFYALALKFFTTTDYSPDYIHNYGLEEVDRIQAEILSILAAEGWDVSGGFTQSIENMAVNPRFYYPDNDEGRDQILDDYKTMLVDIEREMSSHFHDFPEAKVDVQRIPEFKEKTSPGAYYQRPAMDGSRPGVFYANLYDIKATPKYGMKTLAYHEGTPGHHYQLAIQQELEDMPFFRKMVPFTAYTEGWALYAERVAYEMGMLPDPYDNIGRLQAELFRAVRLVVDTGIHAKRWSRERAIDYMLANTGMAESDVVSEIERYFVMPGQATAYKVGMTKILELRAKAEQQLGDQYDIRDFHSAVLNNGSVPLNILEQLVDQYIEATKAGKAQS
ncbi:DUF885 domain-containing protein [Marinicella sp. S1101]|uniref:DUF885 domain-containing protein n=1 Tax=Marinicella marina TaxID=2996016 RepID=UPI0022610478|nr:DUF885 domain-containing protein [Marinicella marina]MCX7553151.1 DUF885 domain-containing protein [Marinicella marina]MDJ1138883.1 DUF885 domain-containing protein [Marinicella marina]